MYSRNNKIWVDYPDGTYEENLDVCCGLVGVHRERSGRLDYYDYDPMKRLIRMQDANGNSVQYSYDASSHLIEQVDAKGNQTRWSYNADGRIVKKTFADGRSESYAYDIPNNIVAMTTQTGKQISRLFDDNGNLLEVHHPDGSASDVSFAYDELDHPVRMVDGLGETTFSYDVLGHLVNADGPWANDNVSYSYDNLGRRSGIGVQRDTSNSDNTAYAYDDLSRLSSISSGAGTFGYNYVGNSNLLTQVDLPNGEKSTFTYDALERLTQLKNLGSGNVNISQYSYAYDNTNHLPGRVSETSQVGTDDSTLRNYGYDSVDQLTSETVSQNGQTTQSKNYAYDQMGNRTQKTYQNGSDPLHTVSYTNNSLNQTTGTSDTDGITTTQSAFTYDANGNTTQVSGSDNSATQYNYDDGDRLSSIIYKDTQGVNVSKSTFTYDGLSRLRISRQYTWDTQTSAWVQQSEKRRIYDGMEVIQERDGNNTVTNSYTRNGNIGGILAMVHYTPDGSGGFTSDKYFYHYDGRGNVTQLTNDSQNIVATYTYDAFGNTTASGAAAELNQYRFSTKEEIKGLYYYGYRFFSPGLGKWINRDPIQETGGINLYEFVKNSPTAFSDGYGLWTFCFIYAQFQVMIGFIGYVYTKKQCIGWSECKGWSSGMLITKAPLFGVGAGVSAGAGGEWTNADSVGKLLGSGWTVGGSAGQGLGVGIDATGGEGYDGVSATVNRSAGLIPVEFHVGISTTTGDVWEERPCG
jgi:RHS repeat-associated protein